jgi:serine/threonine-protein kinase RsbW
MPDTNAAASPAARTLIPDSAWLLRYARSYPGRPDQVRQVRSFLREVLAGRPRADDAISVGSELAANSCTHSRSGAPGGVFTVRAEVSEGDYLHVEVEDQGGRWDPRTCGITAEHGLDLVQAIAGPGHWGVGGDEAGRAVWARLMWPGTTHLGHRPPASPGGVPVCEVDQDAVAELEALAGELRGSGLSVRLVIGAGWLPYLDVRAAGHTAAPRRVYAQAGWFFWPHAERIAGCDDLTAAVATIARSLGADGANPGA